MLLYARIAEFRTSRNATSFNMANASRNASFRWQDRVRRQRPTPGPAPRPPRNELS